MNKVQLGHVPDDPGNRQVLSHEVSSVTLARDLVQRDDILGALLLLP